MSKSRQYLHNLCICLPFVETEIITLCFVFLSLMFFTRENLLWIWIFQCLFLGTFPFLDTLWFCCDIFINLTDFFSCYFRQVNFIDFSPESRPIKWIEKKTNENYFCNLLKIHDGKKRSVVAKLLQKYFHRNVQIALLIFTRIQRFTKFWCLNIQVSEKIVDFHVHLFALD